MTLPATAGLQVAPGEQAGVVGPPVGGSGRALKELVTIGNQQQRIVRVLAVADGDDAHLRFTLACNRFAASKKDECYAIRQGNRSVRPELPAANPAYQKALAELQSGQVLKVTATDPATPKDFDAFARQTGNSLLQSAEEGGKFLFWLRRK